MAVDLDLTPAAREDIQAVIRWYEARSTGLGARFAEMVEECIDLILQNPYLFETVHEQVRRVVVRRFPYVVYYEIIGDKVIVFALLHTARDAKHWRRRLV